MGWFPVSTSAVEGLDPSLLLKTTQSADTDLIGQQDLSPW